MDLSVGKPRGIVGGHVDELEALLFRTERSLAGDAMADPIEPSQALDIEVKQFSRLVAFVTHRWSRWLEALEPAQSLASADPSYGRCADLGHGRDLPNGSTFLSQSDDATPDSRVGRGVRMRP